MERLRQALNSLELAAITVETLLSISERHQHNFQIHHTKGAAPLENKGQVWAKTGQTPL